MGWFDEANRERIGEQVAGYFSDPALTWLRAQVASVMWTPPPPKAKPAKKKAAKPVEIAVGCVSTGTILDLDIARPPTREPKGADMRPIDQPCLKCGGMLIYDLQTDSVFCRDCFAKWAAGARHWTKKPLHRRAVTNRCPSCQTKLEDYKPLAAIGYCPTCKRWRFPVPDYRTAGLEENANLRLKAKEDARRAAGLDEVLTGSHSPEEYNAWRERTGRTDLPYVFQPYPKMLYRGDGQTRVVEDATEHERWLKRGWRDTP